MSKLLTYGGSVLAVLAGVLIALLFVSYAAFAQDGGSGRGGPPNTRITPTPYPTNVPSCNPHDANSCNIPPPTPTPYPTNVPSCNPHDANSCNIPPPTPTPYPTNVPSCNPHDANSCNIPPPTPVPPTETPTPVPPTNTPTPTPPTSTPTPLPTPPAVTGVSVAATTPFGTFKRVNIRWTFIPYAPTYRVERRIGSGGAWGSVLPLRDNGDDWTRQPRRSSDVYPASCAGRNYFRVSARGNGIRYRTAYGPPSASRSISTTALACPTPTPDPCGGPCPTPTNTPTPTPTPTPIPTDTPTPIANSAPAITYTN